MTKHCKSCDRILTIEHLITDKLGGFELQICLECIIAAFEEVLREEHVINTNT